MIRQHCGRPSIQSHFPRRCKLREQRQSVLLSVIECSSTEWSAPNIAKKSAREKQSSPQPRAQGFQEFSHDSSSGSWPLLPNAPPLGDCGLMTHVIAPQPGGKLMRKNSSFSLSSLPGRTGPRAIEAPPWGTARRTSPSLPPFPWLPLSTIK